MTTTAQKKQLAFLNLSEHDGYVSLWINRTLLPSLSTALQNHLHPSLQDLSVACSQFYRGEKESHHNDHCSMQNLTTLTVATADDGKPVEVPGVVFMFRKEILDAASRALMGSKNRAIGKIGIKFRDMQRK